MGAESKGVGGGGRAEVGGRAYAPGWEGSERGGRKEG